MRGGDSDTIIVILRKEGLVAWPPTKECWKLNIMQNKSRRDVFDALANCPPRGLITLVANKTLTLMGGLSSVS